VSVAERSVVCQVSDLDPGQRRVVQPGRRPVILCRSASGAFYAVGTVCPHQGADLCKGRFSGTAIDDGVGHYQWGLDGEVIRCPWHQWEFDVKTGRALFGEEDERIATYEVTVEGSDVLVAHVPRRRDQSA
jgi:3-phenylpropionate/trans-cinnamate dioxygenase ferredoxin subunit